MAKGQIKGNREVRKPKADKTKSAPAKDASFAARSGMTTAPKVGGKKK